MKAVLLKWFLYIHVISIYIGISSRMMKKCVFCLVHVLFCVTYWNIYIGQISNSRTSPVFAFNMQNTTKHFTWSGRVLDHNLHVESKHRTSAPLFYLSKIDIFQYVTQNSTYKRQKKTLYFIILELIPMYTLVLEVVHVCFNRIVFIKAWVAQSVEHRAANLKIVG